MVEMAMTAAGPRRRLRCLIMFVPPNGLNTCWVSGNAPLSTRNRSSRVHSDSQSSALFRDRQVDLPGAGGILALGLIGGGRLMDDLRDAQQRAAVGPGGNRIVKSFVQ